MADGTLAWGIIGPGRIARRFAGQLPLSRTGRLTAVASRDRARAEAFAAEFTTGHASGSGAGPSGGSGAGGAGAGAAAAEGSGPARAYGDYDALLADDAVEAVYIATPHPSHARWAVRAAEAGKHVLCEKPLGVNGAEVMAAVEAARRHDVFLMEAFMYRCHPQTQRLAELVREGAVGEVRQIQATFAFASASSPESRLFDPARAGGGILDVGCYPVSVSRLVAGAARGEPFADPEELTGTGHIGATGVDEWAVATLRFPGGIVAQVATGVTVRAENVVRVFGSEGYLEVPVPWLPAPDAPGRILVHRAGAAPQEVTTPPAAQYACEADTVAEHLAGRQSPAMSWADSIGNAAALDSWRRAAGLVYPAERPDAVIPAVHGRPLRRRDGHRMAYGRIPGVEKPVSRLVMGVDNQVDLAWTSVMFDDFVEQGGTCFDTAWVYGRGRLERQLGQWVRNRGIRDDVVIVGKGAHTPHCDPESLRGQLLESLDRLRTDHVDLYLMHRDNLSVPVGEFVDAMEEQLAAGRVRAYGVSNWTPRRVDEAAAWARAHGRAGFAALSNHFSLAEAYDVPWAGCEHVTDPESRRWLEERGLALLPWSSQARGFFAGRAHPEDRSNAELVRCYYSETNFARLARARELAGRLGVPSTAVALAYVLHQPFPTFPLIGPRTLEEARGSLRALEVELTPEQVSWLETGQPAGGA
jgi:predicted dehydrogenase/aryl-alcohol dehydrogenase-like predicted oxidoreductase